jgi:hypothetical protein
MARRWWPSVYWGSRLRAGEADAVLGVEVI